MPLPLLRTAEPPVTSPSRFGADARFAAPCHVPAGRASETIKQSDDWLADCVRRLGDGTTGPGQDFAEPGEMARRERQERWPDGGMIVVGIVASAIGGALLATAVSLALRVLP